MPSSFIPSSFIPSWKTDPLMVEQLQSADKAASDPSGLFGLVYLCRRLPGTSLEQYIEHYTNVHFKYAVCMPGLIKYLQLPIRKGRESGKMEMIVGGYDSVSVYVYESEQVYKDAVKSQCGLDLEADSLRFIDLPQNVVIPVHCSQEFFNTMNHSQCQIWQATN